MPNRVILVSVDAMVREDLEILSQCPNTAELMKRGSLVESVTTLYPSLTHPVHATLMSGCRPEKTGIVSNEFFLPGVDNPPWLNHMSDVQCKTIFHWAKEAGLKTAACRWPLTDGANDLIDYLVPEVMDADVEAMPDPEELYSSKCSPEIYETIVKPRLSLLRGTEHPYDEEFSTQCAAAIIEAYQPDLLLTHPCYVDATRHKNGVFSPLVREALEATDRWIGMLMDAAKKAGVYEETNFIICSDHGHRNHVRSISLNVLLAQMGLIELDADGHVTDWKAWVKSNCLSALVYVKNPADETEIKALLHKLCAEKLYGFDAVYERSETARLYGLDGDFSFVLEGDGYSVFTDRWTGDIASLLCDLDRGMRSSHGHLPTKGPQPCLLAAGPGILPGKRIPHCHVVDVAPTAAALLGGVLPEAQGTPIRDLLASF